MNIQFNFNPYQGLEDMSVIEIQIGNLIIDRRQMPLMFAKGLFMNLVSQYANDQRPTKITCTKNDYTESGKILKNQLIFKNNVFLKAFGEGS